MSKFNIYCDESCHLENDNSLDGINKTLMVLGAIEIPYKEKNNIFKRIREIKQKHKINSSQEVKWTKISPSNVDLILDLVDYFFDNDDIIFRGLVALDRDKLNNQKYNQTYNDWYYKMYWQLLNIFDPKHEYNIFLDIKDTMGAERVLKLHDVLCNQHYDFNRNIFKQVQLVRSHEVELMQLADILIGALSYTNRNLKSSEAKLKVVNRIKERSGYSLQKSTLKGESKFNLFFWKPKIEIA